MNTFRPLLLVIFAGTVLASGRQVTITVTNPSTLTRPAEMVEVKWADIRKAKISANPQQFIIRDAATNVELPTQTIDENGDGIVEIVIFQSDFKPGETKQFTFVAGLPARVKPLTDARFVTPREDLAWESDRIAYRMYGPALAKEVSNGVDVWVKRVRYPIVEKWYKEDKYHVDNGEGADFFNVGRSVGAGGSALSDGDSLYQPGVFAKYRIIAAGPLRAMFELTYAPVTYQGMRLTEVRRITLDAGKNLNRHQVTYLGEGNAPLTFAAGLVKRKGTAAFSDPKARWVSLWGETNDDPVNGLLGTGIVMPEQFFESVRDNAVHTMITGKTFIGAPVTYYSGAGWTRSGDVPTAEQWNKLLAETAQQIREPLKVTVSSR